MKNSLKSRTLRAKVAFLTVAIGTIPIILVGGLAYFMTNTSLRQQLVQQIIQNQQNQTNEAADKLYRFLLERYGDVWAVSKIPLFSNPEAFKATSQQDREALLNNVVEAYKVYDSLAIFDLNGRVILKSGEVVSDRQSDRAYFKSAQQSNVPRISLPELAPATNQLSIYVTAPIRDRSTGQITSILRARLPVSVLENLLSIAVADRVHLHVTDSTGRSFININSKSLGENLFQLFPLVKEAYETNQTNSDLLSNIEGYPQRLVSATPLRQSDRMPPLDWMVIVNTDPEVVFAPADKLLQTIAFGIVATLLIITVLAIIVSVLVTEPLIRRITQVVQTLVSTSSEIAATIEQQERTLNQQASSISQSTTSMDELNASSQQSAERAQVAESHAQQVLQLTEGGMKAGREALDGIANQQDIVNILAQQITQLNEQARQIGSISALVSDLANQTNMLALNASVEAVRAGEFGKGFSVVASEIRKLADQSRHSAQKIDTLVNRIQTKLDTTVTLAQEGTQNMRENANIARETVDRFAQVQESIQTITIGSQQIAKTAQQQALAIEQVVQAMTALDRSARETANSITQTRIGSQNLNEAALTLQDIV